MLETGVLNHLRVLINFIYVDGIEVFAVVESVLRTCHHRSVEVFERGIFDKSVKTAALAIAEIFVTGRPTAHVEVAMTFVP